MASKRTVRRKVRNRRQALNTARKLSERAEAKLRYLLKRHQAGTLTGMELKTGLKEVTKDLQMMEFHEHDLGPED
jgi:hypothetical protein